MWIAFLKPCRDRIEYLPNCASSSVDVGKLGANKRESQSDRVCGAEGEGGSSGCDRSVGDRHH